MLLGIILFLLSMGFSLICRMWAFSITHNQPLGRADWAFILGWRQRPECFSGCVSSLGLASGLASPFFKPYHHLKFLAHMQNLSVPSKYLVFFQVGFF